MKLNKEKFLQTEFGQKLRECVEGMEEADRKGNQESHRFHRTQWQVFAMAMKQFYDVGCEYSSNENSYGVKLNKKGFFVEWLFWVERGQEHAESTPKEEGIQG